MLVRKGRAATHVGNEVGGWVAWMAEHICVMQGNIPQHHTAPVSDREVTQKTRALQRFTEYWFILAEAHLPQNREDCKQKASAPSASCGCCWSGSSCRNKSLPPLLHFFWSREEDRLGDNHHCCCWTAARGSWHCTRGGWEVQHQPQPAPWSPWEKAKQPPHPSVGYWCDTNIRLQQLHHSDPQLIIAHIQQHQHSEERNEHVVSNLILLLIRC